MRSRRQQRRERAAFIACALIILGLIAAMFFGVMAMTAINTGAALGWMCLCSMLICTVFACLLDGRGL